MNWMGLLSHQSIVNHRPHNRLWWRCLEWESWWWCPIETILALGREGNYPAGALLLPDRGKYQYPGPQQISARRPRAPKGAEIKIGEMLFVLFVNIPGYLGLPPLFITFQEMCRTNPHLRCDYEDKVGSFHFLSKIRIKTDYITLEKRSSARSRLILLLLYHHAVFLWQVATQI